MKLQKAALATIALLGLPVMVASQQQEALSKNYEAVDPNKPVVCLLPGRVRKLGGMMTYLERRKPAEMTASECEIRGGEYTLYDRANYENALAVWRESADQGDATAQVYVGEIYEKGWVGEPDYATAAEWYAKAAAQGDRRAQRRLAYFYENGLGVDQSQEQALGLWRDALGLQEDLVLASEVEAAKTEAQREIDNLVAQLERQNVQTGQLQRNLDEMQSSLAAEREALQRERSGTTRLEQELAVARQGGGDPTRVRELEQQLAEGQARLDEQSIAIELLEADAAAQKAQVAASMARAEVRGRQLARVQGELLAESMRGDSLLLQLQEKDQALDALEMRVGQAEAQLADSRQRQQELASKVTGGQQDAAGRAELERELEQVKLEVADRESRMHELRQEAERQRAAYREQLAQSELREADLNAALEVSKNEKEELARTLKQTTDRLQGLEDDLTQARHALADREAATESLREQLAALDDSDDARRQQLNEKIRQQEQAIAALQAEKTNLVAGWEEMARERDEVRNNLASQVDNASWLDVELESAKNKLAATRDELRAAELALADANFAKQQLAANVRRLEEDLALSSERSRADRELLEGQLRKARMLLADAGSGVDDLRQQTARLESDFEYYGERQRGRTLAMRGMPQPGTTITEVPKGAKNARYHAFIIANYEYDFMPDLSSPPFDANALKQLLERGYGFNVEVLINLNRTEMYKALNKVREFSEDDSVLLYYAGHGKMDKYEDGYWLPTDYRPNQPLSDAISSSDLTQTMNQSQVKHLMLVADSCYSGALARNADPVIRKSVPALVEYWMANRSRTVLTSGGLKPVLDEGPGKHSVFASALLQVLAENSGAINGEMLHAQVYDVVRLEAAELGYLDQKPMFAAVEDAGHENGQFVFLPGT